MQSRVLIIDDNPSDRLIVRTLAQKCGLLTAEAEDAFAALELIADPEETFSLFVIDLQMPKLPGIELLKRLRRTEAHKKTPVLIMSSRNRPLDVQMAVQAGANDYVIKPADLLILEEKIVRLTRGSADAWKLYPVPPEISVSQMALLGNFLTINEVGGEIASTFEVPAGTSLNLSLEALTTRGLPSFIASVISCRRDKTGFVYKVEFVGLSEADRKKIRLFCRELWAAENAPEERAKA